MATPLSDGPAVISDVEVMSATVVLCKESARELSTGLITLVFSTANPQKRERSILWHDVHPYDRRKFRASFSTASTRENGTMGEA
jgi:hypothetical protein